MLADKISGTAPRNCGMTLSRIDWPADHGDGQSRPAGFVVRRHRHFRSIRSRLFEAVRVQLLLT